MLFLITLISRKIQNYLPFKKSYTKVFNLKYIPAIPTGWTVWSREFIDICCHMCLDRIRLSIFQYQSIQVSNRSLLQYFQILLGHTKINGKDSLESCFEKVVSGRQLKS